MKFLIGSIDQVDLLIKSNTVQCVVMLCDFFDLLRYVHKKKYCIVTHFFQNQYKGSEFSIMRFKLDISHIKHVKYLVTYT